MEPRGQPEPGARQGRWAEPGPPPERSTARASGTSREHKSCCKARRKWDVKLSDTERERLWGPGSGSTPQNTGQILKCACHGRAFYQDPWGSRARLSGKNRNLAQANSCANIDSKQRQEFGYSERLSLYVRKHSKACSG